MVSSIDLFIPHTDDTPFQERRGPKRSRIEAGSRERGRWTACSASKPGKRRGRVLAPVGLTGSEFRPPFFLSS